MNSDVTPVLPVSTATPAAAAAVAALAEPVNHLGTRWMLSRRVAANGETVGFPDGLAFYFAGRGGVLGDVHPDVVTAAFGFFAGPLMAAQWRAGTAVMAAGQAALAYRDAMCDWAQSRLGEFDRPTLVRVTELARQVADGADVTGVPLFAGWRALARPDHDDAGDAVLALNLLRELRGGLHLLATRACGVIPAVSVVLTHPEMMGFFGWPEEASLYESLAARGVDLEDQRTRRHAAEALTDELDAAAYSAQPAGVLDELVELALAVCEATQSRPR